VVRFLKLFPVMIRKKERVQLNEADWGNLLKGLHVHARKRVSRLCWKFGPGRLPDAMGVEDLVSEAVQKTLSGVRSWDSRRTPELRLFLESVLDSDIHHLVTSLAHLEMELQSEFQCDAPDQERNPEALLLNPEEVSCDEVIERLHAEFRLDPVVTAVLSSYERQARGPRTILPFRVVHESGLPTHAVRNAIKRLRRKARALRAS
jgi:hypothetical protein